MTTVVFADLVGSTGMFERLGDEAASRFVTQFTTALGQVFAGHGGRVVKLLGDGLFVVFAGEADALAACIGIQKKLKDSPLHPGGTGAPVQVQIGIDAGEVVEIDGDCFGDTVNSAARLADLAGAAQILTTAKVHAGLLPAERASLRSLGPIYLRGRAGSSEVYRVEWQAGRDEDATMAAPSVHASRPQAFLQLSFGGRVLRLEAGGEPLSLGRAADASLVLNDPRVSRVHATLHWRGGQFVLVDASSHGTWVYMGSQQDAVLLRRTECYLVGSGQIVPGCALGDASPPVILFSVGG